MTAPSNPSFALRQQRDGLRQKQFSLARPRGTGQQLGALFASGGAAPDCVFKRLPAIGDIPASPKQHW